MDTVVCIHSFNTLPLPSPVDTDKLWMEQSLAPISGSISVLNCYLSVQVLLLASLPDADPFIMNPGHPFVPYHIRALVNFAQSAQFTRYFNRSGYPPAGENTTYVWEGRHA